MQGYYLGCPMWANKMWTGTLFTRTAKPASFLNQYARVFNTVEGNTTFYGVPGPDTVAKWVDATRESFRFAFKFPRTISHDMGLMDADRERDAFFEALRPLGPRLGVFFLQLPPSFDDFAALERFLVRLPGDFTYAVEARHPCFTAEREEDFFHLLQDLKMDRVVFDTRPLMDYTTDDQEIRAAQRRKPKCPVRFEATGPHPFLRYAGHPAPQENRLALDAWAEVVAGWLNEGRTPFVFMHQVPEDEQAPEQARLFHELLSARSPEVGIMNPWPGEEEPPEPEQLTLF